MAKMPTSISLDPEVKAAAQELFAEMGMDLSTAINIFLTQSIYERSIPFVVHRHKANEATVRAMEEAETMEELHGPFDSFEEMMEAINA